MTEIMQPGREFDAVKDEIKKAHENILKNLNKNDDEKTNWSVVNFIGLKSFLEAELKND